jgi:hypothetical protein
MKTIDKLKKDNRRLLIEYPNDLSISIPIREKVNEWGDESPAWIESFISQIEVKGFAYDRFGGKYTIISKLKY